MSAMLATSGSQSAPSPWEARTVDGAERDVLPLTICAHRRQGRIVHQLLDVHGTSVRLLSRASTCPALTSIPESTRSASRSTPLRRDPTRPTVVRTRFRTDSGSAGASAKPASIRSQTSLLPAETINSRAAVCGRSTPRYADTAARPGNRRSNAAARLRRSSRHSRVCVAWGCLNTGVHAAARSTWKGPMEKDASQSRSAGQRELRRRRGERAFLFDKSLSRCLAEVQREEWELALSSCGGDTVRAARQCGLGGAPPG